MPISRKGLLISELKIILIRISATEKKLRHDKTNAEIIMRADRSILLQPLSQVYKKTLA